jgi:hypothetical protein
MRKLFFSLIMISMFFLFSTPAIAYVYVQPGSCNGGDVVLFTISDPDGGNVATDLFSYKVCGDSNFSRSCYWNFNVFNISSDDGQGHASVTGDYSIPITVNKNISVNDGSCPFFYVTLVTLSGDTNAHVANVSVYNKNVCIANDFPEEICNGIDDDCDGLIDNGLEPDDCPDLCLSLGHNWNASRSPDNYDCCGDDSWPPTMEPFPGWYENPEITWCDGYDNDCDGLIDEGLRTTYYADNDSDGYGNSTFGVRSECGTPWNWSLTDDDCGPFDPSIHPNASEYNCNGIDDDCDGLIDEDCIGCFFPIFADNDLDTYGAGPNIRIDCQWGPGESNNSADCDDTNASVNPGAIEICDDWVDNDCDRNPLAFPPPACNEPQSGCDCADSDCYEVIGICKEDCTNNISDERGGIYNDSFIDCDDPDCDWGDPPGRRWPWANETCDNSSYYNSSNITGRYCSLGANDERDAGPIENITIPQLHTPPDVPTSSVVYIESLITGFGFLGASGMAGGVPSPPPPGARYLYATGDDACNSPSFDNDRNWDYYCSKMQVLLNYQWNDTLLNCSDNISDFCDPDNDEIPENCEGVKAFCNSWERGYCCQRDKFYKEGVTGASCAATERCDDYAKCNVSFVPFTPEWFDNSYCLENPPEPTYERVCCDRVMFGGIQLRIYEKIKIY